MKASVKIGKSFDDGRSFKKDYEGGDFLEFFKDEGKYLDRLANILEDKGKSGDSFTVTYTVTLKR